MYMCEFKLVKKINLKVVKMDEQQYINLFFQRMKSSIKTVPYMIEDIEKKFPRSFILNYYVGFYYEKVGEYEKAEAKFKRSIELEPLFMSPYLSLCSYYMNNERYNDAERFLTGVFGKRMIDMTSGKRERKVSAEDNFKVGSMLGYIYTNGGLRDKAERVYKKMREIFQDYCRDYRSVTYIEGMKMVSLELGKIYAKRNTLEAYNSYCSGLKIKGDVVDSRGMIHDMDKNLLEGCMLQMHYLTGRELGNVKLEDIRDKVSGVYGRYMMPKFPDEFRNGRIHVGYISPDLNKNAVGLFVTPLLKYYDKKKFRVFVYYTNRQADEFTEVFRSYSDVEWVDAGDMDNSMIYNMMKFEHKLDILVDLIAAGHGGKLDLIAMSPANTIINYLGYPGTSGMEQMTHRLTDKVVDVCEEGEYVEELLYMPRSFLCFHMFENIVDINIGYKGRSDGRICIGVMNKVHKHHVSVRRMWREILEENGDVVLYLKRDESNNDIEELYKDFPRGKVVYLPFTSTLERYMEQFNEIDFCMDTYPYSGTTTTCTSLYMGVPVFAVYNENNRHVSNVTGSILLNMGMGEYTSDSLEGYKSKINQYIRGYRSKNIEVERGETRRRFRELMDPEMFMKEYEEVLERVAKTDQSTIVTEIEDNSSKLNARGEVVSDMDVIKYISSMGLNDTDVGAGAGAGAGAFKSQ